MAVRNLAKSLSGNSEIRTSRIFALIKDLSIDAIVTGEECITDDAIAKWAPVWSRHANAHRRLEMSGL